LGKYCFKGNCADCNESGYGCGAGKICQNGECVERICPVVSCTADNICEQCCGVDADKNIIHYRGGICSDEVCVYEQVTCGFGCVDDVGCCGTAEDECCETEPRCAEGLVCDEQTRLCKASEVVCTEGDYRCDASDAERRGRQKCVDIDGVLQWMDDEACSDTEVCDPSNGECVECVVDSDCGLEYECFDSNTERHNYCSENICTYEDTVCEEWHVCANGRCSAVECGSAVDVLCCADDWCGDGLACNTVTGLCESCGGRGELCCDEDDSVNPRCEEGYVCGNSGICGDCYIFDLWWDSEREEKINTSVENQIVYAVAQGTDTCHGTEFSLDSLIIYEKNSFWSGGDEKVDSASGSELMFNENNQVRFEWISQLGHHNLEATYFFEIEYGEDEDESYELLVLMCNEWYRDDGDLLRIMACDDYNNVGSNKKVQCLGDCAGAAAIEAAGLGYSRMQMPVCGWVDGKCALTYVDFGDGNGVGGDSVGGVNGDGYNCMIEYTDMGDCGTGNEYRTVTYIAKEIDANGNAIEGSLNCDAGCGASICTKEVLCPGIVKLPFFDFFNLIMVLLIIGVVYFVMGKIKNFSHFPFQLQRRKGNKRR